MQNCLELLEHKRSNLDSQFLCQIDWFTNSSQFSPEIVGNWWSWQTLVGGLPICFTLCLSLKKKHLGICALQSFLRSLKSWDKRLRDSLKNLMKKLIDGKTWQEYLSCSRTCLNKNSWPQEFFMTPQFHNSRLFGATRAKLIWARIFCRLCWHFEKCKQSRDGVMARHGCTGSSFRASRIFIMCWWPS